MPDTTNPDPNAAALAKATWLLSVAGYSRDKVQAIIEHIEANGTAEGAPWLHPSDLPAIEGVLPDSPEWQSPAWDLLAVAAD
jgi:hypothetical protein